MTEPLQPDAPRTHPGWLAQQPDWPADAQDPQAEELTEAWTALDGLLRAAAGPFDQQRLLRGIQQRLRRRRQTRLAGLLAAAASLLVGAVFLGQFWRAAPSLPSLAIETTDGPAGESADVAALAATVAPGSDQQPAVVLPAWDEPIDELLAETWDSLYEVEARWAAPPDRISALWYEVESLSEDLNDTSL